MTKALKFTMSSVVAGALVLAPLYLAALLLLKVMKSLAPLVRPLSHLVPSWMPAEEILSLLLVLCICFLIGLTFHSPMLRSGWYRVEDFLSRRMPGFALFRSLTQRLAGHSQDSTWKPALAEIEESLVPAFIIEELEDGSFTVFVPSAPTPLTGSIYILIPNRVHPLDVPFTQAVRILSRWGSGSKDLVAAMEKKKIA